MYQDNGDEGLLDKAVTVESVSFLSRAAVGVLFDVSEDAQLSLCSLLGTLTSSAPLNDILFDDSEGKKPSLCHHTLYPKNSEVSGI